MRSFTATFLLIALAADLLVPDSGGGLTIYRIGGSDMAPPPEAGMEGVEFVPLSWEGAAQGFDGQMQGLTRDEKSAMGLSRWCISRLRKIRLISVVLALGKGLH